MGMTGCYRNGIRRCMAGLLAFVLAFGVMVGDVRAEETSDASVSAEDGQKDAWDGLNPDDTILIVGEDEVPLRKAYFLVKFQQAVVQTMQEAAYGSEWYSLPIYEGDRSFQDNMKESVMKLLVRMSLAKSHMDELGIRVSEEEKKKIDETVQLFLDSNSDKALEALMADRDTVTEVLTDYLILSKTITKMTQSVEADYGEPKTYSYIYGSFNGTVDSVVEQLDEASESLIEDLRAIRDAVIAGTDFDTAAAERGKPVAMHTYYAGNDKDELAEMNEVMQELEIGQVSAVTMTKSKSGVFLGCPREVDEGGLAEAKASFLKTVQAKELHKRMSEWVDEAQAQIQEDLWDKVTMENKIATYRMVTQS